jgi:hypothetical protein
LISQNLALPDPDEAIDLFVIDEFGRGLPSICDGLTSIHPPLDRPRLAPRSPGDD